MKSAIKFILHNLLIMANIQPITTWFQGSEHQANVFSLYSTGDNLINSARIRSREKKDRRINENEAIQL